jgi:hypothetical protein
MRGLLLKNTPWDFNQLEKYISCSTGGYDYSNIIETLTIVDKFTTKIDRSVIASDPNEIEKVSSRLSLAAVYARTYFILDRNDLARDLQVYGNNLLARLIELQSNGPKFVEESQINNFRKLLNF